MNGPFFANLFSLMSVSKTNPNLYKNASFLAALCSSIVLLLKVDDFGLGIAILAAIWSSVAFFMSSGTCRTEKP